MIQLSPISIATGAQQYAVRVVEDLCQAFCTNASIQPIANINFAVAGIEVKDGTAFVTINASGSILYQPKGSSGSRTKLFSENFVVAFEGTGTPTISLAEDAQVFEPAKVKCCNRAYAYSITTNLIISATFPT